MKAFVLIKSREAEDIFEHFKDFPNVRAYLVYGGYDVVLEGEFESIEELGKVVINEVRKRFLVDETTTLIVAQM